MSEKEIRAAIDRICGDLDLRARRTARVARGAVFPFVLGAGLAVAACSDDESEPGPTTSNTTTGSGGTGAAGAAGGTAGSTSTAGSTASGGSGATGGAGGDGGMGNMGGMMPPYMAPDAYV